MKITAFLFCLILGVIKLSADMPYNPLSFSLSTSKPAYMEGEKIDFTLTIKNRDETRTYPVLMPGQNSDNKIVYLRVYDPAENEFIVRAEESREINMFIKNITINYIKLLAPGEEITIPFYLFDSENYMTKLESHHSFGKPLFVGTYNFQAFYNPFGSGIGDSLYNFLSDTDQEQSQTKINFLGAALSNPCKVIITKKPVGDLTIEGITYKCIERDKCEHYLYYLGEIADTDMVHIAYIRGEKRIVTFEWTQNQDKTIEWINRSENGNIRVYRLVNDKLCPREYFQREFDDQNEKMILLKSDTYSDGSTKVIYYNPDGTVRTEITYSKKDFIYTQIEYFYKNGKLKRTKNTTGKYEIPCIERQVQILDGE
ncbi:MAG: hypothetical protein WCR42_08190 [bacterium]